MRPDGRLWLRFEHGLHGATLLHVEEQQQPLKAVRAFHSSEGDALVHVHNLSGGVLGGDRLSLRVDAGPRCRAQITSTSATRVYRSRAEAPPAQSAIDVRVEEDGLLEYVPDPLIPFAGARYRQRTTIDLGPGAGLFWWETLAPGREARGELFAYGALDLRFELRTCGVPVAIENSVLDPAARPLSSVARLGRYRYVSSFYISRAGVADGVWRALESRLVEMTQTLSSPVIIWGVSRLPAHGLVVRALGLKGREIASGLIEFWRVAKQALYGRVAVIPRKIY